MEDARLEADKKVEKAQLDWEQAVKSDNIQDYNPGEI
jgi:hypothetical protein